MVTAMNVADRSMVSMTARHWAHRATPRRFRLFLPPSVLSCGTIMASNRRTTEVATQGTTFSVKTVSRSRVLLENRPTTEHRLVELLVVVRMWYRPTRLRPMPGAGIMELIWKIARTVSAKKTPPCRLGASNVPVKVESTWLSPTRVSPGILFNSLDLINLDGVWMYCFASILRGGLVLFCCRGCRLLRVGCGMLLAFWGWGCVVVSVLCWG